MGLFSGPRGFETHSMQLQHDQFQLLIIRCCAESIQSFSTSRSYRISIAQWIRRRANDHPVPRSNPGHWIFSIFHFSLFSWNSHWRARARMSIRLQYLLAVDLFAEDACFLETYFLETCFLETCFLETCFLETCFLFGGWNYTKRIIDTEVIYSILGKGCDFHTHGRAWY